MGLFDNLFLDQNTPVTINDGVDHSKDVVVPVVPPTHTKGTTTGGGGTTIGDDSKKDDKKDDKKDESVSDLFVADKKSEVHADAILHPKHPKDIALEIGKGPILNNAMSPADPAIGGSETSSSEGALSFDIGGDISFDIGGDMGTLSDTPESPAILGTTPLEVVPNIETPPVSGTFLSPEIVAPVLSASVPISSPPIPTPDVSAPIETSATEAISPGAPSVGTLATVEMPATPIDPQTETPENTPHPPLESIVSPVPVVQSGENSLFDLIGGSPEIEVKIPEPTTEVSMSPALSTPVLPGTLQTETPLTSLTGSAPIIPASPLREKLFSYVDELKSMKIHDQTQKSHKLKQIEVLEERIREIDQEALARKKVIKREIDMLHREIDSMDQEDSELDGVVSSFEKELISA